MTLQEHTAAALAQNLEMLKMTIADFSDADLLVRPLPNANHAAWQIGHLICSETRLIQASKVGVIPSLPAGCEEKFTSDTAKLDDPAAFPRKAELLAFCEQQRKATIAWAASLKPADFDVALPEPIRNMIPNVGALLLLIPTHLAMHLGQIQVIRRKLNKPRLF